MWNTELVDFLSVFKGKRAWLGLLKLKDPGAVLELIAVMELGIVRGSIDPHFVDDFEPAVAEPAQGIGVALVLLAMMLIVNLGPSATGQYLRCFPERLVTGALPARHWRFWGSPPKRWRSSPISESKRGAILGPAPGKEPNRS